jgi:hypothetical protein
MRKLLQQLEEMHIRIAETATCEETLVKALAEALNRLDQQLLADVQSIANDHEVRRTAILEELQGLAGGIGMFRAPLPLNHAPAPREIETDIAYYAAPEGQQQGADWRQAASNIGDEFDAPVPTASVRPLFPHEQKRVANGLAERRRRASGG